MTSPNDPEVPLTTRLLQAASALNLLSDPELRAATPEHALRQARETAMDVLDLLGEAATDLLGKQAVLRGLMDTYTAAGGVGVASLGAIEDAIRHGVTGKQAEDDCAVLRKAFEEASGGLPPTIKALVEAIHRGAR